MLRPKQIVLITISFLVLLGFVLARACDGHTGTMPWRPPNKPSRRDGLTPTAKSPDTLIKLAAPSVSPSENKTSSPTPPEDFYPPVDTSTWATYVDSTLNIKFRYPSNWVVKKYYNGVINVVDPNNPRLDIPEFDRVYQCCIVIARSDTARPEIMKPVRYDRVLESRASNAKLTIFELSVYGFDIWNDVYVEDTTSGAALMIYIPRIFEITTRGEAWGTLIGIENSLEFIPQATKGRE